MLVMVWVAVLMILLTVFEKSERVLVVVETADEAELTAEEVVSVTELTTELAALEMAPVISPKPKEAALKAMMRSTMILSISMLVIISILLNRDIILNYSYFLFA